MITREVYSKQVQGEALEDLLPIDNPQEENKFDLTMPQKVFIEAKKLQDEQRLADWQFEKEKENIKEQQLSFEQTHEKLEGIKDECGEVM